MEHPRKRFLVLTLAILCGANFLIWLSVSAEERNELTVAFLNVGQGDAIFIESPAGTQVLIDGGPDSGILAELGGVMPFYDRSIDMLIVSNPDKDHFAGFIDMLKNYEVGMVMEPGTISDTSTYAVFKDMVENEGAQHTLTRRGQVLDLGGGASLYILFPDRDVSGLSTNDGSLVAKLVYGNTSFMLPGDTTKSIEEYLVTLDGERLDSDVLKLAHHGSKTSSSQVFLAATTPDIAIISAGENNRYGHPHQEVMDRLAQLNIPALKTFEGGTIVFQSDGERVWRK